MIDPITTNTARVGELPNEPFSLSDKIPHEVGIDLKSGTVQQLVDLVANVIDTTGGVGFRAVSVTDGQTLPTTTTQEFILLGKGTYYNVSGGDTIVLTKELNAVVSNGSFWFTAVEIEINAEDLGIVQTIRQGFLETTPSENAVYNEFAKVTSSILNQYSSTPSNWIAQSYASGQVVFYGGKQWISKEATAAGDVPSVSSKWEEITFEALNNSVKLTGNQTKTGNLTIANNLNLAAISENTTSGYVLKNNEPFLHNFYAGANPVTGGVGKNLNLGVNSGNFNSNNFTYASTMVGFESGLSNKNGYSNTGIGYFALRLNENGYGNTALGTFVLGNAINSDQNTSVGWHSMLYRTGGSSNTGVGVDVLKENLEGNFNTAFGANAGANNVSGNLNVFLGYAAGFNELGSSKLYISNSSTSNPLLKGDFALNSLSLGGGVGNKVDIYGVGSIVKIDYRNHANFLIPIIHDASGHTFNLNGSPSFTLNGVGAAVGLSSGNINKFEVLVTSSTGGSGVNGMAVHDGQVQRMALLSGVNTASSYGWIQGTKVGVGFRPLFLNPNGGGVSIGNTTDPGTGNLNVAGNITTIAGTAANHAVIKSQLDLKANSASPTFTGTVTVPNGVNSTDAVNKGQLDGVVSSGSYTPTLTASSNITGLTLNSAFYTKVGNVITARITFTFSTTSGNTFSSFTFTLPVNKTTSTSISLGNGNSITGSSVSNSVDVVSTASINTATASFISGAGSGANGKATIFIMYDITQ